MFSRTIQAIQRNQMLFVAVFAITLCSGIAAQSAVGYQVARAAEQAQLAAIAEANLSQARVDLRAVRQSPTFSRPEQNGAALFTPDGRYHYVKVGDGQGVEPGFWVQSDEQPTVVDQSSSVIRLSTEAAVARSFATPTTFNGIGPLALLGWMFGAALFALAGVAIADRRRSRRG
jgi:hypothetical protein